MVSARDPQQDRPIRSYVTRAGRLTGSQRKAIAEHWPDYGIEFQAQELPFGSLFPRAAPLWVEIGFGMGASLLELAQQHPQCNFLGIEVHRPGIGRVLHEIAALELDNLRLMAHDAKEILSHCFADRTIDRLLILFPDPWPKKRHHKRRLIQADFVELLASKLKPGASVHLATDWQAYAEHMMTVLEDCPTLVNAIGPGQYWTEAERPKTKFERRGERLGHGVYDLLFTRLDT